MMHQLILFWRFYTACTWLRGYNIAPYSLEFCLMMSVTSEHRRRGMGELLEMGTRRLNTITSERRLKMIHPGTGCLIRTILPHGSSQHTGPFGVVNADTPCDCTHSAEFVSAHVVVSPPLFLVAFQRLPWKRARCRRCLSPRPLWKQLSLAWTVTATLTTQ